MPCSCFMAVCRSLSFTWGNSSTPLWMRKHLKPATPAWIIGRRWSCKETFMELFALVLFFFVCFFTTWPVCRVHHAKAVHTLPDCQGPRLPRRLHPQNTSLLPPAASRENFQELWWEGCCFCVNNKGLMRASCILFKKNLSKMVPGQS